MKSTAPERKDFIAYIAPFAVFVGMMALDHALGLPAQWFYLVRAVAVTLTILLVSRRVLPLRPSMPLASIVIGIAVFVIWVAPDLLFGYRHFWLFENSVMGKAVSSTPEALRHDTWFLVMRVFVSSMLVPILEELFWRGWLMRWLVNTDFTCVPYNYVRSAFWIVALLFASEHGPYWEVGLAAGAIYNWWVIRTKNLADAMLAHGVTNGILWAYVLMTGKWEYWL